jgi:hypothetical protein
MADNQKVTCKCVTELYSGTEAQSSGLFRVGPKFQKPTTKKIKDST